MKYTICCCFIIGMPVGNQHAFSRDIPELKKDCTICHGGHGSTNMTPGRLLIKPIPDLCVGCHSQRVGTNEHPIGMKPSMEVPQELPLDNGGRITCITCHSPHGKEGNPYMLRKPTKEICQSCHNI